MAKGNVDGGALPDLSAVGEGCPSDLRDVEWARLEPLIPRASLGGRPRKTDMRAAMNAILYLLRTGCPWRYLPREGFPPRSTVYNIFRKFQREGTWEAIWAEGARGVARADKPRGQPLGCGSRQPIGEIGGNVWPAPSASSFRERI
jgi:transposase